MREFPFMISWLFLFFFYITFHLILASFPPRHTLLQSHTLSLLPSSSELQMINGDPRIGRSITIHIYHFSADRKKALVLKDMLETYFPGVSVNLDIQAPVLQKRLLIRGIRIGGVTIIALGEHIFQMIGFRVQPLLIYWSIINNPTLWELWKSTVKILELTEAFEVYFNSELIFSKLKEDRFPTEVELREIVGRYVVDLKVADGLGAGILWL